MSPITTELNIPDIWYDFLGRLLPGYAFLSSIWLIVKGTIEPSILVAVLAIPASYIIGFTCQPITLTLTKWLEKKAAETNCVEEHFVSLSQNSLGTDSRRSLILSKIGAETVFFSQVVFLSLITAYIALRYENCIGAILGCVVAIVALYGAWSYANHRIEKAKSYLSAPSKSPSQRSIL